MQQSATMRRRDTARIILLNEQERVLLVRYEELVPADPKLTGPMSFWVPPGGGVIDGETFEAAIVREIEEETGMALPAGRFPWIWTRDHQLMHGGELKHFHERYFVARVETPSRMWNRTDEPILDMEWWSRDEIERSNETFFPKGLAGLLSDAIAGRYPTTPIAI